jgi:AcrR family transcriptional regulator
MPYPSQTNYETIVQTALQLLEREGSEQLSLALIATTLGVKPPSLYRYIANKDALLRAVNERTFQQLNAEYQTAAASATQPPEQLLAVCRAHRSFAHTHPRAYTLAMTTRADEQRPEQQSLNAIAIPLQTLVAQIVGEKQALSALRGMFALIHGFVMLELHDQLRRGGDLTQAYEEAVSAYIRGTQNHGTAEGLGNHGSAMPS